MFDFSLGYKEKRSGFLISLGYWKPYRSSVLLGIYKRPCWYFTNRSISLGYIYFGYKYIKDVLTGKF